jgi:hypothetical protein
MESGKDRPIKEINSEAYNDMLARAPMVATMTIYENRMTNVDPAMSSSEMEKCLMIKCAE